MVGENDEAPDFELDDQDGKPVRLSSFRGTPVVLYFYPRADTPGYTTQACGIRDHQADYQLAGAVVLGVSPDTPASLRRFADKYGLPFTLLADPAHEVAARYGVWAEKSLYGKKTWGIVRSTFIVDPHGRVARAFPKVRAKQHDELVLRALGELSTA